jgi:arabinogalactan endo-1,4-beta-galactosidase
MLWPDGQINDKNGGFQNLGSLLKSGINAIKDCNKDTKVIIHTANAGSDGAARWFYDGIKSVDVQYDIIGLSYYCFVHGTIHNMQEVVADMKSRYGKPVIIAETSYVFEGNPPWGGHLCEGYPATPVGQANNFHDVQAAASNGGAIGVFYWEPTWLEIKGNGWDPNNIKGTGSVWANQAVFNYSGHLNTLIKWQA